MRIWWATHGKHDGQRSLGPFRAIFGPFRAVSGLFWGIHPFSVTGAEVRLRDVLRPKLGFENVTTRVTHLVPRPNPELEPK